MFTVIYIFSMTVHIFFIFIIQSLKPHFSLQGYLLLNRTINYSSNLNSKNYCHFKNKSMESTHLIIAGDCENRDKQIQADLSLPSLVIVLN